MAEALAESVTVILMGKVPKRLGVPEMVQTRLRIVGGCMLLSELGVDED